MRPHSRRLVLAIAGVAAAAAMEVLKPWPLKVVIDNVLRGEPIAAPLLRGDSRSELLAAACMALVVVYLLAGLLGVANNYLTISICQLIVGDWRAQLFNHLQRLSLRFHRRRAGRDPIVRIGYARFPRESIAIT